ncbi:MAG: hypothetical protein QME06_11275, partial [Desulfobacterales bacterium]|nr:hypothetical protein [Desulfobacterales bacterium]
HCAGIAHQKIGMVDSATYMRVNSRATENLAKPAAKSNPRTNNNQTVAGCLPPGNACRNSICQGYVTP